MGRRHNAKNTGDLPTRIERALRDERFGGLELGDILDHAREGDLDALKPFLRRLLAHPDWTVGADALECVGRFHLRQFLRAVKTRLEDENGIVRDYALSAYYDLVGARALPLLKRVSDAAHVGNRVTALALRYVEAKDQAVLKELSKILLRKRCRYTHRYAAMNTFDAYLDVRRHPEITKLFEAVRRRVSEIPSAYGQKQDIPRKLRKWRRSKRRHVAVGRKPEE